MAAASVYMHLCDQKQQSDPQCAEDRTLIVHPDSYQLYVGCLRSNEEMSACREDRSWE